MKVKILLLIVLALSSCVSAKRKQQRDFRKLQEIILRHPEIMDTVLSVTIDTFYLPEKKIEYKVQIIRDTIRINNDIDSLLSRVDDHLTAAKRITLAKDLKTLFRLRLPNLKDTILIIGRDIIEIKRDGTIKHTQTPAKMPYKKAETRLQAKPVIEKDIPFYQMWWFPLLILLILLIVWAIYRLTK